MLTAVTTPLVPSPATGSTGQRSLLTAYTVVSGALVVSVMVQAAMAGQALFEGFDSEIHGYVGNASFTLGIVGLVAAWIAVLLLPWFGVEGGLQAIASGTAKAEQLASALRLVI
jgi:hypothetical protein